MRSRFLALIWLAIASPAAAQFIYIANAGEDTLSKIDINTNAEVARYRTWFGPGSPNHVVHPPYPPLALAFSPWYGPAPSRTVEDSLGNVYVLNRWFSPPRLHLPVLLKIAPTGGIPFTSTSGGPPLPMNDLDNDDHIDPGEATDVRIQWAAEVGVAGDEGKLGRALCIDPSGVLWVGLFLAQKYYKVSSVTGQVIGSAIPTPGHNPYGCVVDAKGKLWSVDEAHMLAEIDTATNQVTLHDHGPSTANPAGFGSNYSLSLLNGCGGASSKVYLSERTGRTYIAYDPTMSSFSSAPVPTSALFPSTAVGVDLNGDIVSGQWQTTGRVIKSSPSGTVLWDTNALPAGPAVTTPDLHGLVVDKQNNIWAVHLKGNRVVKYSGLDGHWIATVAVGESPYTYSNPPPPDCPCSRIVESQIKCESQSGGSATYSWSFTFINQSPFSTSATSIDISSTQVTGLSPTNYQFPNPVPPNGQATVSGTFTVANPVAGSSVCLDIRINGDKGWCCPFQQVCFRLPECNCARLQGKFKCNLNGTYYLELTVTNNGPAAGQSVQVFSTTPGVTVSPVTTVQTFPQGVPVIVPLNVNGATAGQTINLTVNLHGPIDPKTGVYDWCCTSTVKVTYPEIPCKNGLEGWVFDDVNRNGLRDSEEPAVSGWTVMLTDAAGKSRSATTDDTGTYRLDEVELGTYKLSVSLQEGWRATVPEGGVHSVTVTNAPNRRYDFGVVRAKR